MSYCGTRISRRLHQHTVVELVRTRIQQATVRCAVLPPVKSGLARKTKQWVLSDLGRLGLTHIDYMISYLDHIGIERPIAIWFNQNRFTATGINKYTNLHQVTLRP